MDHTLHSLNKKLVNWENNQPLIRVQKGLSFLVSKDFWQGVLLFSVFVICLMLIQFATPNLVGNDGYYHIKMAYLLRTEGLKPSFDWLQMTVLNPQEYYDHHYLYHILMIPLTFGDLRLGAKIASVIFPAFAFVSVWWLLKGQKVPFAGLWSLGLLIISEAFLYRMSMPRAQSLSLLLLVWSLHFTLTGRERWLIPLGFVYVWSYNAFPLIIMMVGAYVAAVWIIEKKLHWQPLVYASVGVVLGLVLNPYFPENIAFIYRHLAPKLTDATAVSVGNEWFPYKTSTMIENSGMALLVFLAGILGLGMNNRRMNTATATSLFIVMMYGFLLFQSRRFIEYAPPFALIFTAFAWRPIMQDWIQKANNSKITQNQHNIFQSKVINRFIPVLLVILLLPLLWLNISVTRKELQQNAKPYQLYAQASAWLVANTPENSRVFQTDWDDFPRLFFYNSHNTYTIGLDPTYMQIFDSNLYDQWVTITEGKVENPSQAIREQFGSEYILTDLKHNEFIKITKDDERIIQVYEDEYAMIFQVLP